MTKNNIEEIQQFVRNMTKNNIEEIQQFVRKKVLIACHPDWDWKTIEKKNIQHSGQPVTLASVLLALNGKCVEYGYIDGYLITLDPYPPYQKDSIECWKLCKWDLTKEFFDGQETDTQLTIAKEFGYEKKSN